MNALSGEIPEELGQLPELLVLYATSTLKYYCQLIFVLFFYVVYIMV